MSRIFIDRPVFAWVIALLVMLLGGGALRSLPVEQYPDVAPPQVNVRATYPGASAETVQNSVTQVLEQQLSGVDGLLYFSSSSAARGQVTITATFNTGTDPDIAQVQVQNSVQQALSRLPQQVQQQGLRVTKSNPDALMIVVIYDETGRTSNMDVSDFNTSNLQDPLSRIPGVGEVNVFGSPYAMRIWLDPDKLAAVSLMPGDVISAIQSQNTEVAAGEIGAQPQPASQMLTATVTAQSRLQTPAEFAQIIVKSQRSGGSVFLKDVARIELGSESYTSVNRINRNPGSGLAISLSPGADALATAELVKEAVSDLSRSFPPGYKYTYVNDSTEFIKLSVNEVVWTLFEAVLLVVVVMFVFLQSWRATLVPAIAVPVVLLGTLGIFYMAGFTINTMTLFGMVLAIGLLVDDAIVVVENVQRLLEENPGMSPREATIASMAELQTALIAIALVLSAVFLPMAFFGGSTGVIYRQFSLTIVSAMTLSALVALILSPALCATLLRPISPDGHAPNSRFARRFPQQAAWLRSAGDSFNRWFAKASDRYAAQAEGIIMRRRRPLILYAVVAFLLAGLFIRLPTGFLPSEDQGRANLQYRLPAGATMGRNTAVQQQIEDYLLKEEAENIKDLFIAAGGGGNGPSGQNSGQGFFVLKHWEERTSKSNSADAIAQRATGALRGIRDAQVFVLVPPAIRGLGQTAGFSMQLQNSSGMTREQFSAARNQLIEKAARDPMLSNVRPADLPDMPSLQVKMDHERLAALGINQADANATLSTAWGGRYVNDFIDRGRVKRVYVQGDAPFRSAPQDLDRWAVRTSDGQMAPFSAFANTSWSVSPASLGRFQGVPSFEIQGQAAPGVSSGEAMDRIEALAAELTGVSTAWSGLSFQERLSAGQAPILYGLSLIVIFLCLAALYESWSIPIAVLLIVPLGLIGAVIAVTLRGLQNDVYLQIGLLTTMGLAAKNAILMIEFAEQAERNGTPIIQAAISAARMRIRPIVMTSLSFIFGVLPLAISTGAGANSRIAIGTSVIGGMVTSTLLAVFYIPLFFVIVRKLTLRLARKRELSEAPAA